MTGPVDLADGDYFAFADGRGEDDQLQMQVDFDANYTGRASHETVRIQLGRAELLKELESTGSGMPIQNLYRKTQYPLPSNLVHDKSWFKCRMPRLYHHEQIGCPTFIPPKYQGPNSFYADENYTVVSAEWKDAIESVEPGIHEFFPHTLIFVDDIARDRFIFRGRAQVDNCISPRVSLYPEVTEQGDVLKMNFHWALGSAKVEAYVDMAKIADRHWVWHNGEFVVGPLVSRRLALQLAPLLPRFCEFVPLKAKSY